MEVDLGHFKYIFLLESLYGRCTVSLKTLEQSKLKVAYTLVFILLCAFNLIMYIAIQTVTDHPEPLGIQISIVCLWTMSLHALVMTILDYKSKISTALTLQAIEKTLDSLRAPVHGLRMLNIVRSTIILLNIFSLSWSLFLMVISPADTMLIRFVSSFQCVCATLMQGFTLITFLIKIVLIQRTINKEFSKINQNQQTSIGSSEGIPGNRRKRNFENQTESKERTMELTNLQGSLNSVEGVLRDTFWVQIIFYRLIVEILGLVICLSLAREAKVNYALVYYVRMAITFLLIVILVVKMEEEKKKTTETEEYYCNKKGSTGCDRKLRKHQQLARIHRGRRTFSCVFFDVNHDLWAAVLENAAFVVTSMIGSSIINNREPN